MSGRRRGEVRSNLPAEISSFVGRRRDLAEVRRRLADCRLVTVTGIGGVGKTRVALRAAAAAARGFPDGTWLVNLSELQGSMPVAEVASHVLGVRDQSSRPDTDLLIDVLQDKRLLLVIDDCERQAEDCGRLAGHLLRAAPDLRILATSRVPLGTIGESVYPMAPLPVDRPGEVLSDASELFRARAAAVPGVELTDADLHAVAELCRHLDGIPLAIELAAACLSTLSVEQINERLHHRFRLLTANRLGAPRHRTLQTAIDGSYELCPPAQRLLWARLSVFAGDFDLAAVETICTDAELPVLDVPHQLRALVEQSVVTRAAGGGVPRFHLLDTIRDYGTQLLDERGEGPEYGRRYRDYYAGLAAEAETAWAGPDQLRCFERLSRELSNLRAAVDLYLDDPEAVGAGAELAASLWFFWIAGGLLREGRHYLERALARHQRPDRDRRRALWACAFAAGTQGDLDRAETLATECLTGAITAADQRLHANALETLGMVAAIRGHLELAVGQLTEAMHRYESAERFDAGLLRTMPCLGVTLMMRGDTEDALALARRSHTLSEARGERWQRSYVDYLMALALRTQGEALEAMTRVRAAIEVKHQFGDIVGLVMCLELLAGLLADREDGARAARLQGAAQNLWHTVGLQSFGSPFHSKEHQHTTDQARRLLGRTGYDRAFELGRQLSLPDAVAFALDREQVRATPPQAEPGPRLTRRESQIAELIADGLSNREIAEQLAISKRTAESHVENILTKLGFRARTQVAAWVAAARHGPAPDQRA